MESHEGRAYEMEIPPVLFKTTIAALEGSGVRHFGRPRTWLIAAYSADVKRRMSGTTTALWTHIKIFTRRLSHGCSYGGSGSIHLSADADDDDAEVSEAANDGTRE